MKKKYYSKFELVKELAQEVNVPRATVAKLLIALKDIACREAAGGGFTLPDICKIDVVHKKERRMCHPRTRAPMLIVAHDAPRIKILRKAKLAICPSIESRVIHLDANGKPLTNPNAIDEKPQAAIFTKSDFAKSVSFHCSFCNEEIEAPTSTIGFQSECPACGKYILIPNQSTPNTLHGEKRAESTKASLEEDLRNRTIRIDLSTLEEPPAPINSGISFYCKKCNQELLAPTEYIGIEAECAACGEICIVPKTSEEQPTTLTTTDKKQLAQTMRFSLTDF